MNNDKKCLVTADLISQIEWCLKAPTTKIQGQNITWQQKAFEDLQTKLNRTYSDMPIEAQNGINFEKKLFTIATFNPQTTTGSEHFKNIIHVIKGMDYQVKEGKEFDISSYKCYLYAKLDCKSTDSIVDIKTTNNYKESKYKDSFQHLLYMFVTKIYYFEYIVVEWLEYPKINDVYCLPITLKPDYVEAQVVNRIKDAFSFLEDVDLWDLYREKYCLY